MARLIDAEFLNQLRSHLKAEHMKNGQQQFSKTLDELAMELAGMTKEEAKKAASYKNKIFRSLKMLESGGSIKIDHGAGSKANRFTYVDDKLVEELSNINVECNNTIDDIARKGTNFVQDVIDFYHDAVAKRKSDAGEISFLKQAILSLEPYGFDNDKNPMYRVKKGSDFPSILQKFIDEQKNSG